MNIPQEFEDVFQGVELTEDEIWTLNWLTGWDRRTVEHLRSAIQKVQATALSTLQAENEELRAELDQMAACIYYKAGGSCRYGGDDPAIVCVLGPCPHERSVQEVLTELKQVKQGAEGG